MNTKQDLDLTALFAIAKKKPGLTQLLAEQLGFMKKQILSQLLRHAKQFYGENSIDQAWELFRIWDEKKIHPRVLRNRYFSTLVFVSLASIS